jgi:cytochrome c biogenesis protein CcmG/thiol:disulfide interchange protein DsbE
VNRKRSVWALVIAIPVILLLASGFGRDPNAIASPLLNKPAPRFTLRTLDNRPVSMANLRGRPVVLNFWASWCVSCQQEHRNLMAAWRAFRQSGVVFVGIDYEDRASDARDFLHRYGGGWPVLQDPGQQTAINYGVYGVPETFFIDRSGIVRYKSTGPVTPALLARDIPKLVGPGA